jgi:nicotinamidase-related amidase
MLVGKRQHQVEHGGGRRGRTAARGRLSGPRPADHQAPAGRVYDSGLDHQLHRRHIRAIVRGGMASHIGVKSTPRRACDLGYELVFAEDAMTRFGADCRQFPVEHIARHMGKVRCTADILAEITF